MVFEAPTETEKKEIKRVSDGTKVKRVDDRIRHVIEKAVRQNHRCLIALVGDESKTQVMNLHYMLTKARGGCDNQVDVLWCMKNELAFGGMSRKRRLEQNKKEKLSGRIVSSSTHENFESFLSQTSIRYCFYKETTKILGNTYGMTILQDFDSITPNVMARAIETTCGGGIVLLMIRTMTSLEHLHGLIRRTVSGTACPKISRFHGRIMRSFADCRDFLCLDDGLNILPITTSISAMQKDMHKERMVISRTLESKRDELKSAIAKAHPGTLAPLHNLVSTYDQGVALLTLARSIMTQSESQPKRAAEGLGSNVVVAITSGRGRGKSAALGLSIALALQQNMKQVLILAPSLNNLVTLFDFVLRGLKAMGYTEHCDFDKVYSKSSEESHCLSEIRFYGKKRQQIARFLSPQDATRLAAGTFTSSLSSCDLLVIDEGAALPIALIKAITNKSPLTFISSTISGYEGSGRSLAVKLLDTFKKNTAVAPKIARDVTPDGLKETALPAENAFQRIELHEPVRYASCDPVEEWLYKLLCLPSCGEYSKEKAALDDLPALQSKPHPDKCQIQYVSKDFLFSYSTSAEKYLRRVMLTLFHAHYRNQPDDLQVLCDSPNHHIFVLVGPTTQKAAANEVPDILCVVQAVREGGIGPSEAESYLHAGMKPSGDMIPFTLAQYYGNPSLAKLRGLRIIRIATHPDAQRCGYGSHALSLLVDKINSCSHEKKVVHGVQSTDQPTDCTEVLDGVQYIGAMFGVTTKLFKFWSRAHFAPVYLRQQPSEMTGEHSILMLQVINKSNVQIQDGETLPLDEVMQRIRFEFARRYISLAHSTFRNISLDLSVAIAMHTPSGSMTDEQKREQIRHEITTGDLLRLKGFQELKSDFGTVTDLISRLARLFFTKAFALTRKVLKINHHASCSLSAIMITILMGFGIHGHSFDDMIMRSPFASTSITIFQLRSLLTEAVEKLTGELRAVLDTPRLKENNQQKEGADSA